MKQSNSKLVQLLKSAKVVNVGIFSNVEEPEGMTLEIVLNNKTEIELLT
jgi:preprotein translocase subunit YajC